MALKKIIFISTAVVLLIVISFSVYFLYEKQQKYVNTLNYLEFDRQYYETDIQQINVKHSIAGILSPDKTEWTVEVVFNDEPKARYYYLVKHDKVTQASFSGYTKNDIFMHSESVKCGD